MNRTWLSVAFIFVSVVIGCGPDPIDAISIHARVDDASTVIPDGERRAFVLFTTAGPEGLQGVLYFGRGTSDGEFVDLDLSTPPPEESFLTAGAALGVIVVVDDGVEVPSGVFSATDPRAMAVSANTLGSSSEHFVAYLSEEGAQTGMLDPGYQCVGAGPSGFAPVSCDDVVIRDNPFFGLPRP
jgi:hypothetical protein